MDLKLPSWHCLGQGWRPWRLDFSVSVANGALGSLSKGPGSSGWRMGESVSSSVRRSIPCLGCSAGQHSWRTSQPLIASLHYAPSICPGTQIKLLELSRVPVLCISFILIKILPSPAAAAAAAAPAQAEPSCRCKFSLKSYVVTGSFKGACGQASWRSFGISTCKLVRI